MAFRQAGAHCRGVRAPFLGCATFVELNVLRFEIELAGVPCACQGLSNGTQESS